MFGKAPCSVMGMYARGYIHIPQNGMITRFNVFSMSTMLDPKFGKSSATDREAAAPCRNASPHCFSYSSSQITSADLKTVAIVS